MKDSHQRIMISLWFMLIMVILAGCENARQKMLMSKAMSARVDSAPTYNDSALFLQEKLVKQDCDYVMWSMDYSSLCLMGGNYDVAYEELNRCYKDILKHEDLAKERQAALSNESKKLFKGEAYERAMVCVYLGILNYMKGEYNTARMFFTRADLEDSTVFENMKDYRHDFQLAWYWLGRTYIKLDKMDSAAVSFRKAGEHVPRKNEEKEFKKIQKEQDRQCKQRCDLEKKCYAQASAAKPPIENFVDMSLATDYDKMPDTLLETPGQNPVISVAGSLDEFLTLNYQQEVNLILIIEVGTSPAKYLKSETKVDIVRSHYEERQILVYLNGCKAGPAFMMIDLFHQADTRGIGEKDRIQTAKGVTKAILKRMPCVGSVAGCWDVGGDPRYWPLLPGEVHMFAAKVKPGMYTLTLECFDSNGKLLPRYRQTRYCMPVRSNQENIYFLHTKG
jgi:tetratricopeptide (TPR) repeat protein